MALRLLGRQVNGEQEKIAWSIVPCPEKSDGPGGCPAQFSRVHDHLWGGRCSVPYQRRWLLPSRTVGTAVPLNISLPRYGAYWWPDMLAARSGLPFIGWWCQRRRSGVGPKGGAGTDYYRCRQPCRVSNPPLSTKGLGGRKPAFTLWPVPLAKSLKLLVHFNGRACVPGPCI